MCVCVENLGFHAEQQVVNQLDSLKESRDAMHELAFSLLTHAHATSPTSTAATTALIAAAVVAA